MKTKTKILIGVGSLAIIGIVLISGCVEQLVPPEQNQTNQTIITEERAIEIAMGTEEVKEFLKLYPDAELTSYSLVNDVWTFVYRKGEYSTIESLWISVNKTSGETIFSDPKLEFLKNRTYCELDEQCVCLEACVNYISYPKTEFHDVGKCSQHNDCKCINNTCVSINQNN